MSSLITAYEVRYYSPAGTSYDVNQVNRFIETREQYLANKCLGWPFYAALLANRQVYTGIDWNSTDTYAQDAIVNDPSTGILYKAKIAVLANKPVSNVTYWEVAEKFASSVYNLLWAGGLRDYLAVLIYRASLPASTYKGSSQGAVRFMGNGSESVTMDELSYTVGSLKEQETEAYANLVAYLKRNAVGLAWSDCLSEENCDTMSQNKGGFIF